MAPARRRVLNDTTDLPSSARSLKGTDLVGAVDFRPVQDSHARLRDTLVGLTDAGARRPSLLPNWTVGHVLTHLARNADSHVRMLEGARRGEVADQYPGGNEQRAADIEAGAGRPAADLVADVAGSAGRLEEAWAATPEEV
jgi:maleylpyruvate isomerase